MSSRGGGAKRGSASRKPVAEVTYTHTIRARTSNASKWHEVTVTHPDGTVQHLSINAREFPTKTAAKTEAIRQALANKPTYEQEYAKTPTESGRVPSWTANEHLAAVARGEGRSELAEVHERLAKALQENAAYRAQVVVMGKGRSKAATAARAEGEDGMRRTQRDIDALEQRLASMRTAAPMPLVQTESQRRAERQERADRQRLAYDAKSPAARRREDERRRVADATRRNNAKMAARAKQYLVPEAGARRLTEERARSALRQTEATATLLARVRKGADYAVSRADADAEQHAANEALRRQIIEAQQAYIRQAEHLHAVIDAGTFSPPPKSAPKQESLASLREKLGRAEMLLAFERPLIEQHALGALNASGLEHVLNLRAQVAARPGGRGGGARASRDTIAPATPRTRRAKESV